MHKNCNETSWINGKYFWCLCDFVSVHALFGLCIKQDNKDIGASWGVHLLNVNFSDTFTKTTVTVFGQVGNTCRKGSPEE